MHPTHWLISTQVLVDDQLPIRGDNLFFARSRTEGEMWVSMFEKAFAKAYGSYANIEMGSTARTLETLTGAPSTTTTIRGRDAEAATAMFETIDGALKRRHVVCLGMGDHPQDLQRLVGIVEKHAYACLGSAEVQGERLVRIRNPWADGTEYRGKWSDDSEEWTPELRRDLQHGVADDGVFWMAIEDVVGLFDDVVVCAVDDHAHYCHSPRAALPDAKTRLLAFELRPLRTAHVVVTCRQPDTRDDDAATGYHAVRAAVYRLPDANSPAAKRVGASDGEDHTYLVARDVVAADATLHAQRSYIVVVETFEDRERLGPLDGTCVVSTYGGATCAIAPLAPKQGDLAQATCALAFTRFAKDARESNYGADLCRHQPASRFSSQRHRADLASMVWRLTRARKRRDFPYRRWSAFRGDTTHMVTPRREPVHHALHQRVGWSRARGESHVRARELRGLPRYARRRRRRRRRPHRRRPNRKADAAPGRDNAAPHPQVTGRAVVRLQLPPSVLDSRAVEC